eukprot:scaffold242413_cov43-Prasinocladus_malaysianus.AAC.1
MAEASALRVEVGQLRSEVSSVEQAKRIAELNFAELSSACEAMELELSRFHAESVVIDAREAELEMAKAEAGDLRRQLQNLVAQHDKAHQA